MRVGAVAVWPQHVLKRDLTGGLVEGISCVLTFDVLNHPISSLIS